MQHESIDGVVVRVRDTGDHDRYLSILTAEKGRISMLAKGSRSLKGGQTAVSQLYTYGNFEYYKRGDLYILKGGSPMQSFYALSADLDRLNLAAYLCEAVTEVTDEGEPAGEILRLLLNSLYAISRDLYPKELIKGAFEMRVATLSGYAPDLEGCSRCGEASSETTYLDVMNGALLCADCLRKQAPKKIVPESYDEIREAELLCPLSPSALAALRYVSYAPLERLFSFELKEAEDLEAFSKTAESYLLSHLGRGFDSLNFYHMMKGNSPKKGIHL